MLEKVCEHIEEGKKRRIVVTKQYDKHFERISEDFEIQIKNIGRHIFEIMETTDSALQNLTFDESESEKIFTILEETQQEITQLRDSIINEKKRILNKDKITRFQELRQKTTHQKRLWLRDNLREFGSV